MNELTTIPKEDMKMQAADAVPPSPSQMLQAIVKGGITAENVNVFEKAMEIAWRMEERNAQKEFNSAFVALQAELPTIVATTVVKNRGKYEKYEDILKVVQPILSKHGFSVSFSQDFKENRILETCHLRHIGGHSHPNSFAVRCGPADSETQSDCKASTTAKRNAFCNALNIIIRQDVLTAEHDAAIEGDPNAKVTPAQAEELERRAQLTNSNIPKLMKFAGSTTFAGIPARNYEMLDRLLKEKEAASR